MSLTSVLFLTMSLCLFKAFKPLVWKSLLSSVTAVEFLLDHQLDFLSDPSAYQPYQVTHSHSDSTRKPIQVFIFHSVYIQAYIIYCVLIRMKSNVRLQRPLNIARLFRCYKYILSKKKKKPLFL